jgi:predicted MPP superfamily phosphohydrolase
MSVLLQISDTHFGTEQPRVVEALVALAAQQRPDLVVLSGDITQRARPAQFRAAKAFVDRLGAPVLAVPGNHDIALFDLWARLTRPYARYARCSAPISSPCTRRRICWSLASTPRAPGGTRTGRCPRADRSCGKPADRRQPQQLRVVVVHQPAAVTRAEDRANLLRGHHAALRAWSAAGADLVWAGTFICPTRWRRTVWRGDCGCSRPAPPSRRARALRRPIR